MIKRVLGNVGVVIRLKLVGLEFGLTTLVGLGFGLKHFRLVLKFIELTFKLELIIIIERPFVLIFDCFVAIEGPLESVTLVKPFAEE